MADITSVADEVNRQHLRIIEIKVGDDNNNIVTIKYFNERPYINITQLARVKSWDPVVLKKFMQDNNVNVVRTNYISVNDITKIQGFFD